MDKTSRHRLGSVLSALVTLFLVADGGVGLLLPKVLEPEMLATGWPLWTGPIVGATSLVSGLVYALPRTAMVGAILITGFVGGAIATHLRLGEIGSPPQLISAAIGMAAWGALALRGRLFKRAASGCARS